MHRVSFDYMQSLGKRKLHCQVSQVSIESGQTVKEAVNSGKHPLSNRSEISMTIRIQLRSLSLSLLSNECTLNHYSVVTSDDDISRHFRLNDTPFVCLCKKKLVFVFFCTHISHCISTGVNILFRIHFFSLPQPWGYL